VTATTNARYGWATPAEAAAASVAWDERWQRDFSHRWVKRGLGYFLREEPRPPAPEPIPSCRDTIRALEAQINSRGS
jgi:hypothetical protein